jgi:hypothetical protein
VITRSRKDAKAAGYRALTSGYRLPEQQWMLDGVLADMRRAKVDHVVVRDRRGASVWRRAPLRSPSPLPLSPSDGARGFSLRPVTRGGGRKRRAALPRAGMRNPVGVLKLGRRKSARKACAR